MRVPELSAGSGKRKNSLKIQIQNSAAGTWSLGAEGNTSWRCPTGSVSYMDLRKRWRLARCHLQVAPETAVTAISQEKHADGDVAYVKTLNSCP